MRRKSRTQGGGELERTTPDKRREKGVWFFRGKREELLKSPQKTFRTAVAGRHREKKGGMGRGGTQGGTKTTLKMGKAERVFGGNNY